MTSAVFTVTGKCDPALKVAPVCHSVIREAVGEFLALKRSMLGKTFLDSKNYEDKPMIIQ
jgi:hypothetical protein